MLWSRAAEVTDLVSSIRPRFQGCSGTPPPAARSRPMRTEDRPGRRAPGSRQSARGPRLDCTGLGWFPAWVVAVIRARGRRSSPVNKPRPADPVLADRSPDGIPARSRDERIIFGLNGYFPGRANAEGIAFVRFVSTRTWTSTS